MTAPDLPRPDRLVHGGSLTQPKGMKPKPVLAVVVVVALGCLGWTLAAFAVGAALGWWRVWG